MERRRDIRAVIEARVLQSVASPLHSVMREESTRQEAEVLRSRAAEGVTGNNATLRETARHYLCFPWRNIADVRADIGTLAGGDAGIGGMTVTLVGGTGFFARVLADQCLRRGISVTVLARDIDKAKASFVTLYERSVADVSALVAERVEDVPGGSGRCSLRYTGRAKAKAAGQLQLEIVQGDVTCAEAVRHAVRQASLVVYVASAKGSSGNWWRPPWTWGANPGCGKVDVGGMRHTIDACRCVDAHLVALVPLFNRSEWNAPLQWYRRVFVYRHGYLKATRQQERLLLNDDGSPSMLTAQDGCSLRFTLFRVCDIVYPSFNERLAIAKNNNVADPLHRVHLRRGNVDAKLLANVVLRAVSLCRSSIGSRLDVTGQLRHGVDLAHVDTLLHGLRHE
ncbi:hypothetical protein DQ04_02221020 [Trypanosoma grayi]|uniref:hypothetical protein n=1 Tax=Trypanosoma grayi TaxID=71804 RepID=UPI0004F4A0C2|nr:hypothetical protein DQ04_02221020 [Trypanosoma grayi]KEG11840.1 hypothetical protein DQ04_02221020 [Trypanosoma grayi]